MRLMARILLARDAVGEFLDRGIEQFDNEKEHEHADQREAFACIGGQEKGERHADYQQHQLLAERLFGFRRRAQAVPAIDRRPPKPFHALPR